MIFKLQVKKPPFHFSWNFSTILSMVQVITLYFIINILKEFQILTNMNYIYAYFTVIVSLYVIPRPKYVYKFFSRNLSIAAHDVVNEE